MEKCQNLHIGKTMSSCPTLKVHNEDMTKSNETKYLGDWITIDGLNHKNIKERENKGIGMVIQVRGAIKNKKKWSKLGIHPNRGGWR